MDQLIEAQTVDRICRSSGGMLLSDLQSTASAYALMVDYQAEHCIPPPDQYMRSTYQVSEV